MRCPYCHNQKVIKKSFFFIKHSRSHVRRYFCKNCAKSFSKRTSASTYRQKKPFLNAQIFHLLMSGNTQRRSAKLLSCSKNTIAQKLVWLAKNKSTTNKISGEHWQFDEMETIEHTKLKPLTIPICVNEKYEVLGIHVGKIKAKGHLSLISQKKYGFREDEREKIIIEIFEKLAKNTQYQPKTITTDSNPVYVKIIQKYFPETKHIQVHAGEIIKKKKEMIYLASRKRVFDLLFIVNQRCAMLRSDIRRLTRRSWCTTKKIENLGHLLKLYQIYNNQSLL